MKKKRYRENINLEDFFSLFLHTNKNLVCWWWTSNKINHHFFQKKKIENNNYQPYSSSTESIVTKFQASMCGFYFFFWPLFIYLINKNDNNNKKNRNLLREQWKQVYFWILKLFKNRILKTQFSNKTKCFKQFQKNEKNLKLSGILLLFLLI